MEAIMGKDFCCHGNCEQGDECPRRRIDTPGDTRLGFLIVLAGSIAAWLSIFGLVAWGGGK
jgi:hypothetical protein